MTVVLYDIFPDEVNYKEPVFVIVDNLPVPLFFEHFERRGRSGGLAVFSDIDDGEKAAELLGLELHVRAADTGVHGGASPADFTGFRAFIWQEDEDGGVTDEPQAEGAVAGFLDSEMNPLFEVCCNGETILIPAVEEFIEWIDADAGEIGFVIPDGLADLNKT